ncbi:GNAT family N-acetyltransferase [Priestia megaterium]|nr:GNAT family N-acetyltransferase [Priestia megaterium]
MLTEKQLEHIKELQYVCEKEGNLQLKLNWDILRNREDESTDFFHYENGELAGFAGLYSFGNKAEICGMVKPSHRRKGIFSKLLNKALEVCAERKYSEILLNAPANSLSAKAFLMNVPCELLFSEYQMKWSESPIAEPSDVVVRLAKPCDLEAELELDISCFGFSREEAETFNARIKQENEQQFYVIEQNDTVVGKIRVHRDNKEAWIYGVAVFPHHQGKGIARQALATIIAKERKAGYDLFLEVEAKNEHALKLYESCGFQAFCVQDYYQYQTNKID